MPVYLDCNATTPLEPEVRDVLYRYLTDEFGNEGSRTHEFGVRAKRAVQLAKDQIARLVGCAPDEVLFTSGATESNNLAILGLLAHGAACNKRHVITTSIEHKAVLEPLEELERRGFEVTRLRVGTSGSLDPSVLAAALRDDTLLVSVMHVNNETGIIQPLAEVAQVLGTHTAFLHTDAAQGFGKSIDELVNPRLDLISISGHKIFAPKGIGALVARRRGYARPPLTPLMFGGGQQRGIRPGTLPVALIAALGAAAEVALKSAAQREKTCRTQREKALSELARLRPRYTGDQARCLSHVINVAFPGIDSEALIVATKDLISISNGSACTSSSYSPSHVLKAMGMGDDEANQCVRLSWSHLTEMVDWRAVAQRIASLT